MNDPGQHRLWSIPGDGVLARQGDLVLLSSIDEGGFVESLLELLARTHQAGDDGRALGDAIAAAVECHQSWGGGQLGPAVVAFGPSGRGLAFTVSGTGFAEITTAHGMHRLAAGQPSMLMRCVLEVPVRTVRGGLGSNEPGDRTDRFSRLDSGTVRAWGLSYLSGQPGSPAAAPASAPAQASPAMAPAGETPPGPAAQAPPVPAPAEPRQAEPYSGEPYSAADPGAAPYDLEIAEPSIAAPPPGEQTALEPAAGLPAEPPAVPDDTVAEAGEADGAPMVLGVRCKDGHFTDPDARSCVVCGAGISRRSAAPQRGPRPALGTLILEDGAAVEVDSDYVIGRDPIREPAVSAGEARPLRVVDAESTVSRVHARVHLDGWTVLLADLGSANGTRIQQPGAKAEQLLEPRVPVPLRHGTRIFVGAPCLRYERPAAPG